MTPEKGNAVDALLERELELATLTARLDAACAGDGSLIVLEGPAGIGKTSLVRATSTLAEERGMLVLRARGGLLEQGLEYGIVRQLLERVVIDADPKRREELLHGPAAAAAIPLGLSELPQDPGPGRDASGNILHGLHWLVTNLAAEQPVLLAVDDAQWGDFASLQAGNYLAQRLEGMGAAMLVAVRDDDPSEEANTLREILGTNHPTYLKPQPLTTAAVAEVIQSAFGGAEAPADLVAACHHASGGNPFFLTELVTELSKSGRAPSEIPVDSVDAAGPLAVRRSILLRIGQLGPAARAIAEALAILGGEGELDHAAAIAGLPRETAAAAVDQLADAGILDDRRPLRIRQPIVRTAIEEDIAPSERAAAHRRAFIMLRAAGAPEETLAAQALRAEPGGDMKLCELMMRTAERSLRTGTPEAAIEYLERALAEPPGDDLRPVVLAELGRAESRAGRFTEAAGHLDAALAVTEDDERRLAVLRDRAFTTFASAGIDDARALVDSAVAGLAPELAESDAALALKADVALLEWLSGAAGDDGIDLARYRDVAGSTTAERTALALLSQRALCAESDPVAATELARRALAGGRMIAEDTSESLGWYLATYALLGCEELAAARATIEEAIADGERRGSAFARAGALGCRAVLALNEGRPRDAEADALAAASGGLPPTMVLANSAYIVLARVDQGNVDGAAEALADGGLEHGPGGPTVLRFAPWSRARLNELRGDAAAVRNDVAPLQEDERAGMPMRALPWRAVLARALTRGGGGAATEAEAAEARELAAEHLEWARAWNRPAALGIALRAAALAEPAGDGRIDLLAEAVESLGSSALRTEEARARSDLGIALLRAGRRTDGREQLEAALEIVADTGDRAAAERISEELEIAGAAPKRYRFDEMTASERRVAELAAAGKTNREIAAELFVTPKTVENHLTRVYAKLGVSSRKALSGAI